MYFMLTERNPEMIIGLECKPFNEALREPGMFILEKKRVVGRLGEGNANTLKYLKGCHKKCVWGGGGSNCFSFPQKTNTKQ